MRKNISISVVFLMLAVSRAELTVVWNDLSLRAVRYANVAPPVAVQRMAVAHLAIYDAAVGVDRRYLPFAINDAAPPNCSLEASVSTAAYQTLRTLFPKSSEMLDSHHRAILAAIPDSSVKSNGIAWGRRVAAQYLKLRQFNARGQAVAWLTNSEPGQWQRTLPNYDKPLLPHWGQAPTLVIPDADKFLPGPPRSLGSAEWAREFELVKQIGATNSVRRTAEQREIALFWADGSNTETPPGHWNRIAQQLIEKRNYDIVESARLLAALNAAMADAAIVCWNAKFAYNFWRPITAIRGAHTDGNEQTTGDSSWLPLIQSPPFPEHTSGHSTFSGAAAEILARVSGSDEFHFYTTSDSLPGVARRFRRFSDAAAEAGMSRIYGGIHFPHANEEGLVCGRKVAEYVLNHRFQPAPK